MVKLLPAVAITAVTAIQGPASMPLALTALRVTSNGPAPKTEKQVQVAEIIKKLSIPATMAAILRPDDVNPLPVPKILIDAIITLSKNVMPTETGSQNKIAALTLAPKPLNPAKAETPNQIARMAISSAQMIKNIKNVQTETGKP